jgi:tRNA uridine 5-carboxymethylaminomethyl modification enzyme
LEQTPNVDFWQDMVKELIVENYEVKGVVTGMGIRLCLQVGCDYQWDIS